MTVKKNEVEYDYSSQKRKLGKEDETMLDYILVEAMVKNSFHSFDDSYDKDKKVIRTRSETTHLIIPKKDIVCVKSTIPTQLVVKGDYDVYSLYTNNNKNDNAFTLMITQPFSAIYNQLTRNCSNMPYNPYGY